MGRSHPVPTVAVIKELYGTSSTCSSPGCPEPLYRKLSDGSRVLNSRVAHIVARSEGGPRWRADQSEAENRSIENLVLLCIPHASEVDDPNQLHRFDEATLRGWKQQNLGHDTGLSISDEEARSVANESFSSSINITGQTVHFGGQGGQAPGASGGGGAAIGHGSVGGSGGMVGTPNRFFLDGTRGETIGAGGGGGASLSLAHISWQDIPAQQVPHFISTLMEPVHEVRVTTLFLAEAVRTPSGLLYVLGGNPEFFTFESLPQRHSIVAVCAAHLTRLAESTSVKLLATLYSPSRAPILSQEFLLRSGAPGSVSLPHRVFEVHFECGEVGEWRLVISDGETHLAWIPFEVRLKP